jgi:hypothetical protein
MDLMKTRGLFIYFISIIIIILLKKEPITNFGWT